MDWRVIQHFAKDAYTLSMGHTSLQAPFVGLSWRALLMPHKKGSQIGKGSLSEAAAYNIGPNER